MKKQFKNFVAVLGAASLREAFAKELIKLGYNDHYYSDDSEEYPILVNNYEKGVGYIANVDTSFSCYDECKCFNLPEDWDKALKLASEVITYKYVKCIKSGISSAMLGRIYRYSFIEEDSHPFGWITDNGSRDGYNNQPIFERSFVFVEEDEYAKQKAKDLGFNIGDNFRCIDEPVKGWWHHLSKTIDTFDRVRGKEYKITGFKMYGDGLLLLIKDGKSGALSQYVEKSSDFKVLSLVDEGIEVRVTKTKIFADGKEWEIGFLRDILKKMEQSSFNYNSNAVQPIFTNVKIGCTTFSIEELKEVIGTYEAYNDK